MKHKSEDYKISAVEYYLVGNKSQEEGSSKISNRYPLKRNSGEKFSKSARFKCLFIGLN